MHAACTVAGFQGSRVPRLQGSRILEGSRVPRFQGFRVPRSQGSKVPGFQGSRVPGFQGSRVPGFQGFRVPGFQGSRVPFRILKAASPREPAPALEIETQQALLLGIYIYIHQITTSLQRLICNNDRNWIWDQRTLIGLGRVSVVVSSVNFCFRGNPFQYHPSFPSLISPLLAS